MNFIMKDVSKKPKNRSKELITVILGKFGFSMETWSYPKKKKKKKKKKMRSCKRTWQKSLFLPGYFISHVWYQLRM